MFDILRLERDHIEADPIYQKAVEFRKNFNYKDTKAIENAEGRRFEFAKGINP